jgi:predicted sulfurtransferase/23S rRNA-/tRNA-specific pseudouridylate synthase
MALVHSAFYRFVRLSEPSSVAAFVREAAHSLTGSVIVAAEGINGTVAGEHDDVDAFERALHAHQAFATMMFKRSECKTRPFGRMKVRLKDRIVAFGAPDDAVFADRTTAVAPEAWRELIASDDVVLVDNRNSFEYRLGRFANAIDPQVAHFGDFADYVEAHAEQWKRDGKKIAMYCTGGIRCERVAPWMQRLGLKVFELDGGILNFFQQMPDAERDWSGECFVFDNRVALDTKLKQTDTPIEAVYEAEPDGAWRIARAMRLREAVVRQAHHEREHRQVHRERSDGVNTADVSHSAKAQRECEQIDRHPLNASIVGLPSDVSPWLTLLDFFSVRFPHVSRETWQFRFERGEITHMDSRSVGAAARATDLPRAHAKLAYFRHVENETPIPFDEAIVYEDDHIVVADKPHFLPVVPSGAFVQETLLARLRKKLGIETLIPIHRIDRETAGLVVFCIRPNERGAYQSLFRDRHVKKVYEAVAPYRDSLAQPFVHRSRLIDADHFMQMKEVDGEPNSETLIEMIEQKGDIARYRLSPRTGKRHQLRVHMSALGAPIVNDRIYPTLLPTESVVSYENPLQLLAKSIEFVDPFNAEERRFSSARKL